MTCPYATLTRLIISEFVKYPQTLQVHSDIEGKKVRVVVQGHAADQGRLIGADGKNAEAMRKVLKSMAEHRGLNGCHYSVLEPSEGEREPKGFTPFDTNWVRDGKDKAIIELAHRICALLFTQPVEISAKPGRTQTDLTFSGCGNIGSELELSLGRVFSVIGHTRGRIIKLQFADRANPPL